MGFRQDPRLEREAGRERFEGDKRFVLENDAALRLEFAPEDLAIQASDVALRAVRADPLDFLEDPERHDGDRDDLGVRVGKRGAGRLSVVLENLDGPHAPGGGEARVRSGVAAATDSTCET